MTETKLKHICIELGAYEGFFAQMKHTNKKKFNFIFSFDDNAYRSINEYTQYVSNIILKMEEVIFYFDKKKKAYADFIKDYKILKAPDKYRTLDKDSELVFRIRECELDYLQFDFNVLQKFIKIVDAFEIMKEDKDTK